jgi:uncharacterized membrane protein YfcA
MALAAICAGWVDAVVGGGGLIQLPALLLGFPQATPVQILATNKLGSICGTSVSAVTYYRRVKPDLRTAIPLALLAFGGSLVGALLASHIPKAVFNPLILVVLIAVGTYTVFKPGVGLETDLRFSGRRHVLTATGTGFLIGMYDGALGPGTGTFFVFALVNLLGYAFLEASAKAKIVNMATNAGALLFFLPHGSLLWGLGLVLGLANMAGGYLGARTAVKQGSRFIRVVFLIVVGALIVKLGHDIWQDTFG